MRLKGATPDPEMSSDCNIGLAVHGAEEIIQGDIFPNEA